MGKLTLTKHLKACAEAARNFTNSLVAELAQTVMEAMQELESVKADKQPSVSITIPTTGWGIDDTSESYPNYYDIAALGLTAKDRVDIAIDPSCMSIAIACEICPTNETKTDCIRIWAKNVPAEAIDAEYWLSEGKESAE